MPTTPEDQQIYRLPIESELDLHTFRPQDVKSLTRDYVGECLKKGIYEIRIIHGKGRGTLRRIVHSVLDDLPEVLSYKLAGEGRGSWGATLVLLKANHD